MIGLSQWLDHGFSQGTNSLGEVARRIPGTVYDISCTVPIFKELLYHSAHRFPV